MKKPVKTQKKLVRMLLFVLAFTLSAGLGVTASAQEADPPTVTAVESQYTSQALPQALPLTITPSTGIDEVDTMFGSLTDFLFGIVKIVGAVATLFGLVQLGLSISNHDPSQRSQGFLFIAGGVIVFFAPEILGFLTGGI